MESSYSQPAVWRVRRPANASGSGTRVAEVKTPRRKGASRQSTPDDEPRVEPVRDEMGAKPADTRNRRVIAVVRVKRMFKKRGE